MKIRFCHVHAFAAIYLIPLLYSVGISATTAEDRALVDDLLQEVDAYPKTPQGRYDSGPLIEDFEPYRRLKELGPNVLPRLAERLAAVEDVSIMRSYIDLFIHTSAFHFFFYTTSAATRPAGDTLVSNASTLPFLTVCMDESSLLPSPASERHRKGLLLGWWRQRDAFPSVRDRAEVMRRVFGKSEADFAQVTPATYREYTRQLLGYGIYNIPVYVDLVAEDNSPLAFLEIFRVARNPVLPEINLVSAPGAAVARVTARWPERKDKAAVIKAWWREKSGTYMKLEPLYKAIDEEIRKLP